jgi:hypothetical protein
MQSLTNVRKVRYKPVSNLSIYEPFKSVLHNVKHNSEKKKVKKSGQKAQLAKLTHSLQTRLFATFFTT